MLRSNAPAPVLGLDIAARHSASVFRYDEFAQSASIAATRVIRREEVAVHKSFCGLLACALLALNAGCSVTAVRPFTDPRGAGASGAKQTMEVGDPACTVPTLVSTGGPFPASAQTLAIRWTGYANFELVY